jgi:MFS family permease
MLRRIGPQPALATGLAVIAAADAALTVAAPHPWALSACAAAAGAGLGLSSVAATTLGTTVPEVLRGTASGIINTAAQLGTAVGIAALLLIADATTGAPGPGTGAPVIAWAAAAALAAAGALAFTRSPQSDPPTICPAGPKADKNPAADNTPQTHRDDGVISCQRETTMRRIHADWP